MRAGPVIIGWCVQLSLALSGGGGRASNWLSKAGPLGWIGYSLIVAACAIVGVFEARRRPFAPLLPSSAASLCLGLAFALVSIDLGIAARGWTVVASLVVVWLMLSAFVYVVLRAQQRQGKGR